jgi:hypothetical protein
VFLSLSTSGNRENQSGWHLIKGKYCPVTAASRNKTSSLPDSGQLVLNLQNARERCTGGKGTTQFSQLEPWWVKQTPSSGQQLISLTRKKPTKLTKALSKGSSFFPRFQNWQRR